MTKIIEIKLDTNASAYESSILKILDVHRTETEPFALIAIYADLDSNCPPITLQVQLFAAINLLRVATSSQWTGQMVAVNPPMQSHWLIRHFNKMWGQRMNWDINITDDVDSARQLIQEIVKVNHPM